MKIIDILKNSEELLKDMKSYRDFITGTIKNNRQVYKTLSKEEAKEKCVKLLASLDWCNKDRDEFIDTVVQWRLAEDELDYVKIIEDDREFSTGNTRGFYSSKKIFLREDMFKKPELLAEDLETLLHELRHNRDFRKELVVSKKGKDKLHSEKDSSIISKFQDNNKEYSHYYTEHYEELARKFSLEQGLELVDGASEYLKLNSKENQEDQKNIEIKEILNKARWEFRVAQKNEKKELEAHNKIIEESKPRLNEKIAKWQTKTINKQIKNFGILNGMPEKLKPLKRVLSNVYDLAVFQQDSLFLQTLPYYSNSKELRKFYENCKNNSPGFLPMIVNNSNFGHKQEDVDEVAKLYKQEYGKNLGLYFMFKEMTKIQGYEILKSYYNATGDLDSIALTMSIIGKQTRPHKVSLNSTTKVVKNLLRGVENSEVKRFKEETDEISSHLYELLPESLSKSKLKDCVENYIVDGMEILKENGQKELAGIFKQNTIKSFREKLERDTPIILIDSEGIIFDSLKENNKGTSNSKELNDDNTFEK